MNNCDHTLNTLRYADRVKERDSESGKLSEKVMAASKIVRKVTSARTAALLQRPSTAPATALEKKLSLKKINDANSPIKASATYDEAFNEEVEWSSEDESEQELIKSEDEPEEELFESEDDLHDIDNDILVTTSTKEATSNNNRALRSLSPPRIRIDKEANRKPYKLKEASTSLINTHRNIMTGMLNTVKHEMTLVNYTDADRNTIDDYLDDLEKVLESNKSMISTLRESLLEYYAVRGEIGNKTDKKVESSKDMSCVIEDDGLLSDDTFEDLRD